MNNKIINNITPFIAIHPGEFLADEIKARKISVSQFSAISGIDLLSLYDLINGKCDITEAIADELENALKIPAYIWINLQNKFDIDSEVILQRKEAFLQSEAKA